MASQATAQGMLLAPKGRHLHEKSGRSQLLQLRAVRERAAAQGHLEGFSEICLDIANLGNVDANGALPSDFGLSAYLASLPTVTGAWTRAGASKWLVSFQVSAKYFRRRAFSFFSMFRRTSSSRRLPSMFVTAATDKACT
mmetsp:Transcript_5719/g.12385  ORF Transcript_5719/g.12385 Transcript_5719/m.12385 type:complete len:140 (-) Transcript_5719:709-1128(-)